MTLRICWNDDVERSRPRYGKTWTPSEYRELQNCWNADMRIEQIAYQMGRPILGILIKLEDMKLLQAFDKYPNSWTYMAKRVCPNPQTEVRQENNMSTKNIETQTLIRGRNAAEMTDEEIFGFIANLEKKLEGMDTIKAKSVKLEAAKSALQEDINNLVMYVDGR